LLAFTSKQHLNHPTYAEYIEDWGTEVCKKHKHGKNPKWKAHVQQPHTIEQGKHQKWCIYYHWLTDRCIGHLTTTWHKHTRQKAHVGTTDMQKHKKKTISQNLNQHINTNDMPKAGIASYGKLNLEN
jgi:hypothetical protein